MKRLFILRHAKSSWGDPQQPDFDRPLNGRGLGAARAMGEEMRGRGLGFDSVLASPAARTRETLERLQQGFGSKLAAQFDERIYEASAEDLMTVVRQSGAGSETLLLIGHNPGLQMLTLRLTEPDETGFRRRVQAKFPTAALAGLSLSIDSWEMVRDGCGAIDWLVAPKDLQGQ